MSKDKGLIETMIDDAAQTFTTKWVHENVIPEIRQGAHSICMRALNTMYIVAAKGVNTVFKVNTPINAPGFIANGVNYNSFSTNVKFGQETVVSAPYDYGKRGRINRDISPSEVPFATYQDAQNVWFALVNHIQNYQVVGLDKFYELAGYDITDADWHIANYGWTNMNGAGVERKGNAYYINLPKFIKVR